MEGGVDDADDGSVVDDEADGDAEHGEDVGVVYGSLPVSQYLLLVQVALFFHLLDLHTVQRINAPCWLLVDEVVARLSFGICFFAKEPDPSVFQFINPFIDKLTCGRDISPEAHS